MKPVNEYYVKEKLKDLRITIEKEVCNEKLYANLMQKIDSLEFYIFNEVTFPALKEESN